MPESAAVNIRNRSYTITAEVDITDPKASGVLFSHGARFGGHSLYLKDGVLKYVYNFVGEKEQMITCSQADPTRQGAALGRFRAREQGTADDGDADALHQR